MGRPAIVTNDTSARRVCANVSAAVTCVPGTTSKSAGRPTAIWPASGSLSTRAGAVVTIRRTSDDVTESAAKRGPHLVQEITRAGHAGVAAQTHMRPRVRRCIEKRACANRPAEEKRIRRRTPHQADSSREKVAPTTLRSTPHRGRARCSGRKQPSAPSRVISSAAAPSTPSAAWTMNGIVAGVRAAFSRHRSANFAVCADGPPLEAQGVRPSERLHHTHRKAALQLAVDRVVMSHRGDAGEHVLQPTDEQTIAKRVRTVLTNSRIVDERRPQIVDPGRRVFISIATFEPAVMIQLEVIVRVNQPRKDECTVQIDHVIVPVRRLVERHDALGKTDRRCRTVRGRDTTVDERYGTRAPKHHRSLDRPDAVCIRIVSGVSTDGRSSG